MSTRTYGLHIKKVSIIWGGTVIHGMLLLLHLMDSKIVIEYSLIEAITSFCYSEAFQSLYFPCCSLK